MCKKEQDFPAIIKSAPRMLTEEEKRDLEREFYHLDDYLDELKQQIVAGREAYQTLIRLEESNGQNTAEYQEMVRRIGKVNDIDEQEQFMNFIKFYAKQTEYAVAEDIYTAEELSVKEIAERGIRLLNGYEEGINIAMAQVDAILKPVLKKECSD